MSAPKFKRLSVRFGPDDVEAKIFWEKIIHSVKVDYKNLHRWMSFPQKPANDSFFLCNFAVPPRWLNSMPPPREVDLLLEESADISCDATGSPSPDISWTAKGNYALFHHESAPTKTVTLA